MDPFDEPVQPLDFVSAGTADGEYIVCNGLNPDNSDPLCIGDTGQMSTHHSGKSSCNNIVQLLQEMNYCSTLEKPPFNFNTLVTMAITSSPTGYSTVPEIIKFISNTFPYYKNTSGWEDYVWSAIRRGQFICKCLCPAPENSIKGCYMTKYDLWSVQRINACKTLQKTFLTKGKSRCAKRKYKNSEVSSTKLDRLSLEPCIVEEESTCKLVSTCHSYNSTYNWLGNEDIQHLSEKLIEALNNTLTVSLPPFGYTLCIILAFISSNKKTLRTSDIVSLFPQMFSYLNKNKVLLRRSILRALTREHFFFKSPVTDINISRCEWSWSLDLDSSSIMKLIQKALIRLNKNEASKTKKMEFTSTEITSRVTLEAVSSEPNEIMIWETADLLSSSRSDTPLEEQCKKFDIVDSKKENKANDDVHPDKIITGLSLEIDSNVLNQPKYIATEELSSYDAAKVFKTEEKKLNEKTSDTIFRLIAQGILSAPKGYLSLTEIYNFCMKNFPPYKEKYQWWNKYIRVILNRNRNSYIHIPRENSGGYWTFHPLAAAQFTSEATNKRMQSGKVKKCDKRSKLNEVTKHHKINGRGYLLYRKRKMLVKRKLSSIRSTRRNKEKTKVQDKHVDNNCSEKLSCPPAFVRIQRSAFIDKLAIDSKNNTKQELYSPFDEVESDSMWKGWNSPSAKLISTQKHLLTLIEDTKRLCSPTNIQREDFLGFDRDLWSGHWRGWEKVSTKRYQQLLTKIKKLEGSLDLVQVLKECERDVQLEVQTLEKDAYNGQKFQNNVNIKQSLPMDKNLEEDLPDVIQHRLKDLMSIVTSFSNKEPPLSYTVLIIIALVSSSDLRLPFSDIIKFIQDKFQYYSSRNESWITSVLKTLCLNSVFTKACVSACHSRKFQHDGCWRVDPFIAAEILGRTLKIQETKTLEKDAYNGQKFQSNVNIKQSLPMDKNLEEDLPDVIQHRLKISEECLFPIHAEKTLEQPPVQSISSVTPQEDFMCKICDKVFTCEFDFKHHEYTHSKNKRNPCYVCHKVYPSPEVLWIHVATKHQGQQKHQNSSLCQASKHHEKKMTGTTVEKIRFCEGNVNLHTEDNLNTVLNPSANEGLVASDQIDASNEKKK